MKRDVNSSNKINNFDKNQKLFYEALDGKKREEPEQPDPIEATTFWRNIWSEEVSHNERVSWL